MTKKSELEAAYLRGLGVAVIVLTVNAEMISFEMARWPGAEHWKPADIVAAFCFERASHAELVMCSLTTLPADTDQAMRLFAQAIDAVGARWCSTEAIAQLAEKEIAELEIQIKAWNVTGGFKAINAAYKKHRDLGRATFVSTISYSDYLHQLKLKIVRAVGENIAAGRERFAGVADIKPDPLPTIKRRDHFKPEETMGRWPGQHRESVVFEGWSPSLRAHPREHRARIDRESES